MAESEHVLILRKGVPNWNSWRQKNPRIRPDLRKASLVEADLQRGDFSRANLAGANLSRADLSGAVMTGADLSETELYGADLSQANLSSADLSGANFYRVILWETLFSDNDLSGVAGLEFCKHRGPSALDLRTIARSGRLPEVFLRGCGLPDRLIEYLPSLLDSPVQFYSCFLSYSSRDQSVAEQLHSDLQARGIRCWFAPQDMPIGASIRSAIDEAIRLHDKLLLILSEASVKSQWVEQEVEKAFEKERMEGRSVLFPVRVDDAVFDVRAGWASFLRNTRHIGDFRCWTQTEKYKESFQRLLRDLKAADGIERLPFSEVSR